MGEDGPESHYAAEADSLSLRCLLLLEQLLPVERTAFLLHDVFGRSRAETARIVGVGDAACQQSLLRAHRVMSAAKTTIEAERREGRDITARFFAVIGEGDADRLADLLAFDAVAYVDATHLPVVGRHAVVHLLGRMSADGRVVDNVSLEIGGGLVQTVRWPARYPAG